MTAGTEQDSTGSDVGGEASAGGGEDTATAYIAAELRRLRQEREGLQVRLGAVQDRERTLWADARRAGVSFGRIGDVSGVDRATVFYALNPRGKARDTATGQTEGDSPQAQDD